MKSTDADEMRTVNKMAVLLIKQIFTSLGTIILSLGLTWAVAKPHAENFIKETVKTERFASQEAFIAVKNQVEQILKNQVDDDKEQERLKTDIELIKTLQAEQRADIKELIRGLKN